MKIKLFGRTFAYLQVFYKITIHSVTRRRPILRKLSIDWSKYYQTTRLQYIHIFLNGFLKCPCATLLYTVLPASTVNAHFSLRSPALCPAKGHIGACIQSHTTFPILIIFSHPRIGSSPSDGISTVATSPLTASTVISVHFRGDISSSVSQ